MHQLAIREKTVKDKTLLKEIRESPTKNYEPDKESNFNDDHTLSKSSLKEQGKEEESSQHGSTHGWSIRQKVLEESNRNSRTVP